MIRRARPDGTVVLTFPGARQAPVAAVSLAVSVTEATREVILAAPLIAASWARSVAATARAEGVAVRVEPVTTADLAGITAEVVRAERDSLKAFPDWLHTSLRAPEPEGLDQLRAECLGRLASAERRSDDVRRAMFGAQHRYGIVHAERSAYLREVSAGELTGVTAALLRAPLILATSDSDAALPAALASPGPVDEAGHAAREARGESAAPLGPAQRMAGRERVVVPITGERAFYLAGTAGVTLGSDAKFPLHVAWALLGGREGLLDQRLRRECALTYSLAAFSRELADGGYGIFFAGCGPEALDQVAAEGKAAVERLCAGDIPSALLRSAKERLIIQHQRALQAERDLAERLCGYEVAGLGPHRIAEYPARIAAVRATDVQVAAATFLTPDSLLEIWMVPSSFSSRPAAAGP